MLPKGIVFPHFPIHIISYPYINCRVRVLPAKFRDAIAILGVAQGAQGSARLSSGSSDTLALLIHMIP